MSRVERSPLSIPSGVEVVLIGQEITVKGKKGTLQQIIDEKVRVVVEDKLIKFLPDKTYDQAVKIAGTMRAIIRNMLIGVSDGYQIKLILEGVGYRAQAQGTVLNLSVGFSHPIKYTLPKLIGVETPSQTEIILKSIDKQLLGQAAAEIRGFQPPEPYKGKGIRYDGEKIAFKEGKKK